MTTSKTESTATGLSKLMVLPLLSMISLGLTSCDNRKKTIAVEVPKAPSSFSDSEFEQLVPMLDGAVYVKDYGARWWYVRGNQAVRVTVLGSSNAKLPDFLEMTPLTNGGAYGHSEGSREGLWYFKAEYAEKVKEVPANTLNSAHSNP